MKLVTSKLNHPLNLFLNPFRKTQHLPLHGTMSSPSSSCSARESGTLTTGLNATQTTTAAAAASVAATTAGTTGVSTTYRHITTSSLKRQKSTTCTNTVHLNGQHNHIISHHHHNHQHHHHTHSLTSSSSSSHSHQQQQHSHPNRATIIKHSKNGSNSDYGDVFSRKSSKLTFNFLSLFLFD